MFSKPLNSDRETKSERIAAKTPFTYATVANAFEAVGIPYPPTCACDVKATDDGGAAEYRDGSGGRVAASVVCSASTGVAGSAGADSGADIPGGSGAALGSVSGVALGVKLVADALADRSAARISRDVGTASPARSATGRRNEGGKWERRSLPFDDMM